MSIQSANLEKVRHNFIIIGSANNLVNLGPDAEKGAHWESASSIPKWMEIWIWRGNFYKNILAHFFS